MSVRWYGNERKHDIERGLSRAVLRAAHTLRNEMIRLILDTPKSGRMYGKHQASAPGEPPASDIGTTVRSIRVRHSGLRATITIGGAGALLEFGTSKMAPRPFVRPAIANKKHEIERIAGISIKAELK